MGRMDDVKLEEKVVSLENQLQWYRATYETRSILGIIKDRFLGNLSRISKVSIFRSRLTTTFLPGNSSAKVAGNAVQNKQVDVAEINQPEQIFYYPKNRHEKLTEFHKIKPFFLKKTEKKKENTIEKEVDIIVPIYNGIHFLKILLPQIFERSDLPFRLILVNDCSPDKEIKPFLETFLKHTNVLLLNNKNNLGFTASVNRGLKEVRNDVVILNTDTELPFNWLSRLFYPIFTDSTIATVTPFSNCATIASFPKFDDNPIFENLTVDKIDDIFNKLVKPVNIEIPTGVGFCMAISKSALETVGFLDEERFPKGYGEEVDWCRRAKKKGLKNVFIPNLFIYHKHGGSFDSVTKTNLSKAHQYTIDVLYPEFIPEVKNFIEHSIQNHVRNFLLLLTCSEIASKTIVYFDHELGGGANMYTDQIISENKDENLVICISFIHPNYNSKKRYALRYFYKDYFNYIHFENLDELKDFFDFIKITDLVIGSLITHENLVDVISMLTEIITLQKCRSTYLVHDYHSCCPNFTLMYKGEYFCDIPDLRKCETCLVKINLPSVLINKDFTNLPNYRSLWFKFFTTSIDEIVCFAPSGKKIIMKTYPSLPEDKIKIIPHAVRDYRPIVIGIIGNIHSEGKGGLIIQRMAQILEKENKNNVRIILLGEISPQFDHSAIQKSGAYTRDILYDLIRKNFIDLFLIPSVLPETFSYTTAEAILTGLPVFSYNLGGQADQVKNYKNGIILNEIEVNSTLQTITKYIQSKREINKSANYVSDMLTTV